MIDKYLCFLTLIIIATAQNCSLISNSIWEGQYWTTDFQFNGMQCVKTIRGNLAYNAQRGFIDFKGVIISGYTQITFINLSCNPFVGGVIQFIGKCVNDQLIVDGLFGFKNKQEIKVTTNQFGVISLKLAQIQKCSAVKQFNKFYSCRCKSPPTCKTDFELDGQTCLCRCIAKTCPIARKWNYSKCQCL